MTLRKDYIISIILGMLFILLLEAGRYYAGYSRDHLSAVSARYTTDGVTRSEITSALKNIEKLSLFGIPEVTLWNRYQEEKLLNRNSKAEVIANVIEVNGDMSQVLPMMFTGGNYVYQGDKKGCVLDTKTAFQLFGTENVINNIVIWKNKEYVVRGVTKADDTVMLIQTAGEKEIFSEIEAVYDGNSVDNRGKNIENQERLLKELLLQNGMPKPAIILDGVLDTQILQVLYKLPLWLLALWGVISMIKATAACRKSIVRICAWSILTLAALFLFQRLTDFHFHIPIQFIPTKWSDFNFYTDKYNEIRRNAEIAKHMELMPKDVLRRELMVKACILTIFNCLILLLLRLKIIKRIS